MSKKTTTSALVVLGGQELTYSQEQLTKVQAAALEQLSRIRSLERESAGRAILAGLALHRVKASLKHGAFIPWLSANVKGGRTQANYYMRLASVFVERAHVTKPDLLALPGDQTELAIDSGGDAARTFFQKLSDFVGQRSLSELLEKYGIKHLPQLGGKKEAAEKDEPSAPVDPETLRLQSMDEISAAWERSRALLLRENRLQHFTAHPEQVQAIVQGFRDLANEIEKAAKPILTAKA